jgi:hypothetical protein
MAQSSGVLQLLGDRIAAHRLFPAPIPRLRKFGVVMIHRQAHSPWPQSQAEREYHV